MVPGVMLRAPRDEALTVDEFEAGRPPVVQAALSRLASRTLEAKLVERILELFEMFLERVRAG